MISYWERNTFTNYDIIIVGAGIVGLQTAIYLKCKYPNKSIAILERSILPYGASTRNAGFACMGSIGELIEDLRTLPIEAIVDLFEKRYHGIQLWRSIYGDTAIGYEANGSYELLTEAASYLLDEIPFFNNALNHIHGRAIFSAASEKVQSMHINTQHFPYAIESNVEGSIDSGKLLQALWRKAQSLHIDIFTGAMVNDIYRETHSIVVQVTDSTRKDPIYFQTGKVCICTNAFAKKFIPAADIFPGRGQVLITHPIPGLKLKGTFHMERGYYYARNVGDRILIGGGRHEALEKENTSGIALNEVLQERLKQYLSSYLIPNIAYTVDLQWAGIMAFGTDKKPIVTALSPNIYAAYRMGGMGVALGATVAAELATLVEV